MAKKRYNTVNKRITKFIFADYLSSYYKSQARHLYAISAFKISWSYLIKVCGFFCLFFFLKKGFFSLYEKYVSFPVPFLCMIFAEITFSSLINLEQALTALVLFFLTYQLSCGMRYLILSVLMSLLVRVIVRFIENSGQSCGFILL